MCGNWDSCPFPCRLLTGSLSGKVYAKAKSMAKLGALCVPELFSCPFSWAVNNSGLGKTSPSDMFTMAVGGAESDVWVQNSERGAYSDPPNSDFFTAKTSGDRGPVRVTNVLRATKERIICPRVNSAALHWAPDTGRCTPQPLGVWVLVTHSCVPVARPYSERTIT